MLTVCDAGGHPRRLPEPAVVSLIMIAGVIQTTRLFKCVIGAVLLAVGSGSATYGVSALLFLTFSFAFNDWVDAPKDSVGHPDRAIPSGKITRGQAGYLWLGLLVSGLVCLELFLSEYLVSFAVMYLLSISYSFFLKPNVPLLATPVWSLAVAILFVQPFTLEPLAFIAFASCMYGYELLLDYRKDADRQFCKTPTLANLLGTRTSVVAGLFFVIGGILFAQLLF